MLSFQWKKLGVIAGLSLSLVAAGCGQADANDTSNNAKESTTNESEEMDYTITGLEPGAGQTELNDQAIDEYESLAGWEQETSSTGAMLSALDKAIENEEPIMITAWSPHYMFAKWDIKYLEDPKGVFGEEIYAATLVREGLRDDMPTAYTLMERFNWDISEVDSALLKAEEEQLEMDVIAAQWIDENEDTVSEWTEGIETVDGTSMELAATTWDDALFTANVAKIVLEQQGFDVTLTPVDPAILFESIASGDADATLSPWLPTTHGALYEEYEGEFEDIGKNIEGGKLGLAVPSYMEADSLEDFEPAE
ncbi:glycine/betaine ABC transporter [Virgibacillus sp. MSJ-26]|uniref:glycine betaine ABC transporter substrate-binding protein n=1 Tax=Virgibacillus sp. MSJ-26 TaxID=2841522 RepID=UPI001C0FB3D7|nr:glycine betaine ABC transporter substrate-binding protein [Virgibacillus sp. MSJ-26]MBU5467883.1 glycine/betaine ABC transporter [Virgibacillus sp. MSJ-26]